MNRKRHYESGAAEAAARILGNQRLLRNQAAAAREEAARCRELATGTAGGIVLSAGSCASGNPAEEAMIRLLSAEERWREAAERLTREEARIGTALSRLPAEDALLLHLRWLRELPWCAVALRLHMSERTARRRHEPALAAFREAYGEEKKNDGAVLIDSFVSHTGD